MTEKYKYFVLIPLFFISFISCSKSEKKIDAFTNFSQSDETQVKIVKSFEEKKEEEVEENIKEIKKEEKPELKDIPNKEQEEESKPNKIFKTKILTSKIFNLRYLSFDVANFYFDISEISKSRYKAKIYSKTNGVVDYLFGWMSYTEAVFHESGDDVIPEKFNTKVVLKKKERTISLAYNKGEISSESVLPPDNRWKRPAVEEKLKEKTLDPISAVWKIRKSTIEAIDENYFSEKGMYNFSVPIYEGRRRYDLMITLFKKKENGLLKLEARQKIVAGFTNNEIEDSKKEKRVITFFIDPKTYWAVRAEGTSIIGTATAGFKGDCKTKFEDCIKQK